MNKELDGEQIAVYCMAYGVCMATAGSAGRHIVSGLVTIVYYTEQVLRRSIPLPSVYCQYIEGNVYTLIYEHTSVYMN